MNKIILSIVIPIYNIEKYVEECISSIEFPGLENKVQIICVNDGSTDSSREVIVSCMKKFSNLTLVDQNNSGVSVARNVGMEHAKGKYIWFIDGDDYLIKGAISYIVKILEDKNNNLPLLVNSIGVDEFQKMPENTRNFKIKKVKYKAPPGANFIILPREVACKYKFEQNLNYGEDYFWTFLLGNNFDKVLRIRPSLYCYRRRSTSAMNCKNAMATENRIKSFINLYFNYERLDKNKIMLIKNSRELSRRKKQCVQACLITAIFNNLNRAETDKMLNILKNNNMYPYGIIYDNLKPRKNMSEMRINIISLPLSIEKYFWLLYKLVNKNE